MELARLIERDRKPRAGIGAALLERLARLLVQVSRGEMEDVGVADPQEEHPVDNGR
jgi:hypothetical protein